MRPVSSGERIATLAWAGVDGQFDTDPAPKVDFDQDEDLLTATKLFVPDLAIADLIVVVGSSSGRTRVSATVVMKFESPGQRGSTCM